MSCILHGLFPKIEWVKANDSRGLCHLLGQNVKTNALFLRFSYSNWKYHSPSSIVCHTCLNVSLHSFFYCISDVTYLPTLMDIFQAVWIPQLWIICYQTKHFFNYRAERFFLYLCCKIHVFVTIHVCKTKCMWCTLKFVKILCETNL